jgi:ATP-binding cassette subfamily F protein 3
MPLITVQNLTKYYDTDLILDHIAFAIDHRERLGLIGANGSGKTTLFRILTGHEPFEDDSVIHRARGMTVGYLSQDVDFGSAADPWQVVMSCFGALHAMEADLRALEHELAEVSAEGRTDDLLDQHARLQSEYEASGGLDYQRRAAAVLTGLGVPEQDFGRPLHTFSGGEQRRIALARLLLTQPSLLLMDEPTNHLDIAGIEWLENYLRDYSGAVVAVSHDRRFLDNTAQRMLELECHNLYEYRGGYSDYMLQKEQRVLTYERQFERQQDEMRRQMSFIRWALGTGQEKKVKAAKSRLKLLDKMDCLDPPLSQRRKMNLRFQPLVRGGDDILQLRGMGKAFGDKRLFTGINLYLRRGQRLGIVGPNGCGKSTLVRIILGLDKPSEGESIMGRSVQVGYHRQDEFGLDPENRVYEEFRGAVPDAEEAEVRNLLARFLFVGDDIYKGVGDLSGGEQSRLSLAKLVMSRPTLLVLDEPTNHLDIDSRSSLESALKEYEGTLVVVSHDRYFLDNVVNRVLVMHEGVGVVHEGNYSSYVAHRAEREAEAHAAAEVMRRRWREERQREERLARRRKRKAGAAAGDGGENLPPVEELETRAAYLERQLARATGILGDPATYENPARAAALGAEHDRLSSELHQVYEMWERAEALTRPR